MARKEIEMCRVNLNFPSDVLAKIDNRSRELGMTRTSFVAMCVTRQLEEEEALKSLPDILSAMRMLQGAALPVSSK